MSNPTAVAGQLIYLVSRKTYGVEINIQNGYIAAIHKTKSRKGPFILPGFIDAHIHIESSMLVPSEFAKLALPFGTLATVSDPHEIANVLGLDGVYYMLENAEELTILLVLVSSGLSFAGSVNFDFRFESDSASYNSAAKTAGAKESSQFLMRTGRVDFKGTLNKDVSYRFRWGIDHDSDTTQHKTDNFSTQVDYAYIQHQISERLAFTAGKFASEVGSIEGNMSSPDIYMPSQSYKAISSNDFLYVSGGKLTYSQMEQEASVFLANQSESQSTEQTKMAYGIVYKGFAAGGDTRIWMAALILNGAWGLGTALLLKIRVGFANRGDRGWTTASTMAGCSGCLA